MAQVNTQDHRDMRALRLLRESGQWAKCRVRREDGTLVKMYGIPSSSEPGVYRMANQRFCNCPDFLFRQPQPCAHVRAVRMYVEYVMARRRQMEQEQRAREINEQNERQAVAAAGGDPDNDQGTVYAF